MLSQDLIQCVHFAKWCAREGKEPNEVAMLISLARKAAAAGVRYCNVGTDKTYVGELKAADNFERQAKKMGYTVDWPGLWPVLHNARGDSTYEIFLP